VTEICRTLPATVEAVEALSVEFRALCGCLASESDRFAAELLLREVLMNAVVHGSRGDATKQVRCELCISPDELRIAVEDEGDGFDWQAAGQGGPQEPAPSGRGLEILRKYATRIWFNDKGNETRIVKRFNEAEKR